MSDDLTTIRNIGPATAAALVAAGIPDAPSLRAIGADGAYGRLIRAGERPHFIGYYILHMALQGRPWNDCRGAEKEALRRRFDALVAETRQETGGLPPAVEAQLDALGLGRRR